MYIYPFPLINWIKLLNKIIVQNNLLMNLNYEYFYILNFEWNIGFTIIIRCCFLCSLEIQQKKSPFLKMISGGKFFYTQFIERMFVLHTDDWSRGVGILVVATRYNTFRFENNHILSVNRVRLVFQEVKSKKFRVNF